MGENTKIEWARHTFNGWLGCTKLTPACDNCYAEAWAKRSGLVEWGPHAERRLTSAANWKKPAKWNAAAKAAGERHSVFSGSLSDWLDKKAPDGGRERLAGVIEQTPELDWLLLTKRPENFDTYAPWKRHEVPANVWIGATVEDQVRARHRRRHLAALADAGVKTFVSYEPALGPVDWYGWDFIRWMISGGESGPKARASRPAWHRSTRDWCAMHYIPYLFKQWGEWAPPSAFGAFQYGPVTDRHGNVRDWMRQYVVCGDRADRLDAHSFDGHATNLVFRVGKARAGRLLDGIEHNEFPKVAA